MQAQDADDVFISFRFGGANGETEARALKAELLAHGTSTFLSHAAAGDNLAKLISDAIVGCKLAIIFASRTYGARTNDMFDTGRERDYILSRRKPYFLIRMIRFPKDPAAPTEDERWAESETVLAFPPSVMQKLWLPGQRMPGDLVAEVVARMGTIAPAASRAEAESAAAVAGSSAAVESAAADAAPVGVHLELESST